MMMIMIMMMMMMMMMMVINIIIIILQYLRNVDDSGRCTYTETRLGFGLMGQSAE